MEVARAWETRRRLLVTLFRVNAPSSIYAAPRFQKRPRYYIFTPSDTARSSSSVSFAPDSVVTERELRQGGKAQREVGGVGDIKDRASKPPKISRSHATNRLPAKEFVETRYRGKRRTIRGNEREKVQRSRASTSEALDSTTFRVRQDTSTRDDPEIESILAETEETAGRSPPPPPVGKRSSSDKHTQWPSPKKEPWQIQKQALKEKFQHGWNPRKKLSPDTVEGIRALHEQDPDRYTTPVLAQEFKVSAEAIRRMLKSKWRPPPEKAEERRERWAKRHDKIWDQQAELGLRPQRTKERGVESPDAFEEDLGARQVLANQ